MLLLLLLINPLLLLLLSMQKYDKSIGLLISSFVVADTADKSILDRSLMLLISYLLSVAAKRKE